MANSAFEHAPSFTIPGSTTDNAVIRWDGTSGAGQQNSGILIDDSNVITGITSLTVDNLNINGNTIISTDSNGSITLTPNGSGSVVISKVDINSGDITGVTVSGGLTWSAAQNFNSQNLTNVDIDSGTVDGATIGASSASTVVATQVDITGQGDLRLQDTTGGQHVAIQAAGTTTTHTLTLPATQGGSSTVLTNDGSGGLTWAAAGGGTTINGTTDNAIITYINSSGEFQAEANLKFDGTNFGIGSGMSLNHAFVMHQTGTDDEDGMTFQNSANNHHMRIKLDSGNSFVMSNGGNGGITIDTAGAISSGIKFPASQNASSNANTLDDYEEGTWTPTLTDTSGNTGSGYTARNGYYTKIGRTVFFSGRILTNSISGLTGGNRANVAGLPFTSTGSTDGETVVSITLGRGGMDLSTGEVLSAYVNNSQTRFAMQKFTTTEYVNLTITEWTANGGCHFSGHYMVP